MFVFFFSSYSLFVCVIVHRGNVVASCCAQMKLFEADSMLYEKLGLGESMKVITP